MEGGGEAVERSELEVERCVLGGVGGRRRFAEVVEVDKGIVLLVPNCRLNFAPGH